MSEHTTRATGTIEVAQWSPTAYDTLEDGPTLVRIDVVETFHGDIDGEGCAQLLQALHPDGSASFVGLERVTGTVAGRQGTFVLQDAGTLDATGRVEGTWTVVAGSATGGLAGLRGRGGFTAALGEHATIHLDHWFE